MTAPPCSVCGRPQSVVDKLVAGGIPSFFICNLCVGELSERAADARQVESAQHECRFCKRTQATLLIRPNRSGDAVCVECLRVCEEIIASDLPPPSVLRKARRVAWRLKTTVRRLMGLKSRVRSNSRLDPTAGPVTAPADASAAPGPTAGQPNR